MIWCGCAGRVMVLSDREKSDKPSPIHATLIPKGTLYEQVIPEAHPNSMRNVGADQANARQDGSGSGSIRASSREHRTINAA